MSSRLQCMLCTRTYPWDSPRSRCECGGLLDVVHPVQDLKARAKHFLGSKPFSAGPAGPGIQSGVWAFAEFVYPKRPKHPVSRAEGNTPLLSHPSLSAWTGVDAFWVKHEGENPTGSFKDRGMTVAVTHAVDTGQRALACASTGNTAASLAAYGALAGLPVLVFVPAGKIARGKLAQAVAYGAHVIQVKGDFDASLALVQKVCEELGVALLNSINPYRIEGQKSAAFEISRDFNWSPPDWVVLPAGNLGNLSAYGKAFHELHELGLISRIPRLAGIQATGANPFYRSYRQGFSKRYRVKAETLATAIRIGDPASYERAVRALKWTNGVVAEVTDEEILAAKERVDGSGIGCEPASAASVAGVRKLRAEGVIAADDSVVAVLTGHLLKDPDIVLNRWQTSANAYLDATDEDLALRAVEELLNRQAGEVHHG